MHGILTAIRYNLEFDNEINGSFIEDLLSCLEKSVEFMLGKLFAENASFADMSAAINAIIDDRYAEVS